MRRIIKENNKLSVKFPETIKQWHPTKNRNLQPDQISYGSIKKVWWKCPIHDDHEWEQSPNARTHTQTLSGCPHCAPAKSSKGEIRVLTELQYLFNINDVLWRDKTHGAEIDIYVPKFRIGIEYDGYYWHKNKNKNDLKKNELLSKKGIIIFRVREELLNLQTKNDITVNNRQLTKNDLNQLIDKFKNLLDKPSHVKANKYINQKDFINDKEYKRFLSYLPKPPPEYSILKTHPFIADQWHPSLNGYLKPEYFGYGSHEKVWWKCPKGDEHEWKSTIKDRTNKKKKSGCPFCSGLLVSEKNRLDLNSPKVAKQWHPTKNGSLKPEHVSFGSGKKVWWKCPKGDDHEWEGRLSDRTIKDAGCPFCAGQKVSKTNRLDLNFPKVAKQWHPTKNGSLKPHQVIFGSTLEIWWKCPKGDDHEWEMSIKNRTRRGDNSKCKFCKLLSVKSPEIAKQWHPTKNGNLQPDQISYGSPKKVWWKCPVNDNHEWETRVADRRSNGCPHCFRENRIAKT